MSRSEAQVAAHADAPLLRWPQWVAASGVPPWLFVLADASCRWSLSVDLGTPSLWDPEEGLPAEVAREMLLTRRWLTPQLNFNLTSRSLPRTFRLSRARCACLARKMRQPSVCLPCSSPSCAAGSDDVGLADTCDRSPARSAGCLTTTAGTSPSGRLAIEDAAAGLLLSIAMLGMSEPLISRRAGFPWIFYAGAGGGGGLGRSGGATVHRSSPSLSPCGSANPAGFSICRPLRGLGVLVAVLGPVFVLAAAHDPGYASGCSASTA